jgi:2-methylcitrate dehydratase PrpD
MNEADRTCLAFHGAIADFELTTGDAEQAARLLVADSVLCAVAAAPADRTQLALGMVSAFEGMPQAEVVGTALRLPAPTAALVNADAMNLLDADDTFLEAGHFGALQVAVAVAATQRQHGSWRDLLRAVVLGFEVCARLQLAAPAGPVFLATGQLSVGAAVTAMSAAPVRERRTVGNTIGLAMRHANAPTPRSAVLANLGSVKYTPFGSIAATALLTADLAAAGYQADPLLLHASPGFSQAQGAAPANPALLYAPLAPPWAVTRTSLKPYPSFRTGHPAIDALKAAMADMPEVAQAAGEPARLLAPILRIDAHVSEAALRLPIHDATEEIPDDHLAPIRTAMDLRHSLALTLLGVPPGPQWSDARWLRDADVRACKSRIDVAAGPGGGALASVRIVTASGEWWGHCRHNDGDFEPAARRPDWAWIRRKAQNFGVGPEIVDAIEQAPLEARVREVYRHAAHNAHLAAAIGDGPPAGASTPI